MTESHQIEAQIDVEPVRMIDEDLVLCVTEAGEEIELWQDELEHDVIDSRAAMEEAEQMAREIAESWHLDEIEDEEDLWRAIDGWRDYANYANNILPKLRALAGMGDRGHGTYQERREVYDIEVKKVTDTQYVFDEVFHVFDEELHRVLRERLEE